MPLSLNKKTIIWHIAIVCIVVVALYARVTKNDYVDLDDTTLIVNNYPFLKDFSNAPQAFRQGIFQASGKQDTDVTFYRPVMELTFMLDANMFPVKGNERISASPFLRANIVYHLIACILLLLFLYNLNINPLASLLLTLLFAVHPVLLQAIAWIPGRNDSLVTIFILASFLMLLSFNMRAKVYELVWFWLFFAMALFTKESALVMPVVVLLYLILRAEKTSLKNYVALLGGQILIIVLWFTMRQSALAHNASNTSVPEMLKNVFTNLPMFFQYVAKSVIPFGYSVVSTLQDTNYLLGIIAIALIGIGIFLSKEKNMKVVIFGLSWYIIFLAPSFLTQFSGLEHRDYLPLIGLLIVISEFDFVKKMQAANIKLFVPAGLVIALFAGITFSREPIFLNAYNFDKSAIETSPHAVLPCLWMARHYEQVGDYENALKTYDVAMEREPNGDMIHNSMGTDYIMMNQPAKAEQEFKKELQYHPKNTLAMFNLGLFNLNSGRDSVAESLGQQSIAIDPEFVKGHELLAAVHLHKGDTIGALPYLAWLQKRGIQFPPPPGQ